MKEFIKNHKTACIITGSILGAAAFAALGYIGYRELTKEDEQKLVDEVTDDAQ